MTDSPAYTWIESLEDLNALKTVCEAAEWLAIDLEANSMFCYRERVCLLQINAAGKLYMVDTLALPGEISDLDALRGCLENPEQPCYLHGGEYDVSCLKRDYNISPQAVWDSQQAASYLGFAHTGYGHLAQEFCGVELDKSYSQYNWGTRPLDQAALDYAINDVIYLPVIIHALQAQIVEHDLGEEITIANQAVMDASPARKEFDPAEVYRVKGFSRLHPDKHPVLLALFSWRDQLAKQHDLPAGRIVNSETLIQLAQKTPTNFGSLKRIRLKSWILRDHGGEIMDLVKQAMREPPALPERSIPQRKIEAPERQREQRLKDWRRTESERRNVPFQVVLPARALSHFKQFGADDFSAVPQFGPRRTQLYGAKIKEICERAYEQTDKKDKTAKKGKALEDTPDED